MRKYFMKKLNRLLAISFFTVVAITIEASDEQPYKFARIESTSPITSAALLAILSPQAIVLSPMISKLDLWRQKMSHISRRLDGDLLVSCFQEVDINNLGIISQQVFNIVQDLHDFRIDITCLSQSEVSRVDAWSVSRNLHKFSSVHGTAAIKMQREPYMQDIVRMLQSDYSAIRQELVIRGLYREQDLLTESLSQKVKIFYDRACQIRADLVKGEKSKFILESELYDLEKHQPECANLAKNMEDKIQRLKETLSTYEQNKNLIDRIAVRRIFSDAEKLAVSIFLSDKTSQQDDHALQYQQLIADHAATNFGDHEKEVVASLSCVASLLKNQVNHGK